MQLGAPCSPAPTLWIEPDLPVALDRAVGADVRLPAALGVGQHRPRRHHPAFDQQAERDARRRALVGHHRHRAFVERQRRVDPRRARPSHSWARARSRSICAPAAAPPRRSSRCRRTGRARRRPAWCRRAGCGRAGSRASASDAPCRRHRPWRARRPPQIGSTQSDAHLQIVVERLHRAIVEGVFRLLVLGAPDQRLMRVGEAGAAEIGHRVGLAPDDVVQDPEVGVLQQRADAVDVVIAADHPDRAVVLQDAARLGQPFAGEIVVDREAVELVPIVVDSIDPAAFGPEQVAAAAGDCRADRRRSCRPTCRAAAPFRRCSRPR